MICGAASILGICEGYAKPSKGFERGSESLIAYDPEASAFRPIVDYIQRFGAEALYQRTPLLLGP